MNPFGMINPENWYYVEDESVEDESVEDDS